MSQARSKSEWLSAIKHDKCSVVSGKPYRYLNLPSHVPSRTMVTGKCPDHGEWTTNAAAHLNHRCPGCGLIVMSEAKKGQPNHRRFSLTQALEKARAIHADIDYAKVASYSGNKDVWALTCLIHNTEFETTVFSHLYDKARGCPGCRKERIVEVSGSQSEDRNWQWRAQIDRLGYKVVSHSGAHEPCVLRCPIHGKFTLAKAYYLSQGWSICPQCRPGSSQPEQSLVKALRDLGHKVELHRRDILKDREVDVYLPRHKIAIEVNGVFYHDTAVKDRRYHADKQKRLLDLGITLFSFTDMEINSRLPLVLSMIQAKCGLSKNRTGARNTNIEEITSEKARKFFNANHMQGFCGAKHHLGAYVFNGSAGKRILAAVASFSTPRFSGKENAGWELIRFATLKNTQIAGMLSRLITHFRREHSGSIFSYANLRYGSGNAYRALGFEFLGRSAPSYFWINKEGHQLSRYQTKKSELDNILDSYEEEETEVENMARHGYWQIWDCGNLRFILR